MSSKGRTINSQTMVTGDQFLSVIFWGESLERIYDLSIFMTHCQLGSSNLLSFCVFFGYY
jgi:hypothetical protein